MWDFFENPADAEPPAAPKNLLEQVLCDDDPLHLVRALIDLRDLCGRGRTREELECGAGSSRTSDTNLGQLTSRRRLVGIAEITLNEVLYNDGYENTVMKTLTGSWSCPRIDKLGRHSGVPVRPGGFPNASSG
jgi:hypothetical protein